MGDLTCDLCGEDGGNYSWLYEGAHCRECYVSAFDDWCSSVMPRDGTAVRASSEEVGSSYDRWVIPRYRYDIRFWKWVWNEWENIRVNYIEAWRG